MAVGGLAGSVALYGALRRSTVRRRRCAFHGAAARSTALVATALHGAPCAPGDRSRSAAHRVVSIRSQGAGVGESLTTPLPRGSPWIGARRSFGPRVAEWVDRGSPPTRRDASEHPHGGRRKSRPEVCSHAPC